MRATPYRISLTESSARPILAGVSVELGQSPKEIVAALGQASRRLRKVQRMKVEPIQIDGDHVEVSGVAGLVRIEPGLELEVAPKFLGAESPGWREDFFRIAGLTRRGWILPHEEIAASRGHSNDLASLVGNVMVSLFKHEERLPIRVYDRRRWSAFEIDGDLDEESVVLPSDEGFAQEKIVFERRNRYNEVIGEAARLLVPSVENQDIRRQLQRMGVILSARRRPRPLATVPPQVPSRHRRWQQLYDVSRSVLTGFSMRYGEDEAPAPGFVLKTWSAWEDLLHLALQTGLPGSVVSGQHPHRLGQRNGGDLSVRPDGTVSGGMDGFLWDAKYKAEWEEGKQRISAPDLYEANAFLQAADRRRIVLLYPRLATQPLAACGSTDRFETVELSTGVIEGIFVEARGIGASGGFQRFATNLAAGIGPRTPT
jgi:5-methylcytosine-specific restriction enzyme subunit McrC